MVEIKLDEIIRIFPEGPLLVAQPCLSMTYDVNTMQLVGSLMCSSSLYL